MADEIAQSPEFESKLLPILREAVDVVKMIFFAKLKEHMATRHPEMDRSMTLKLAGAVINTVFGTPSPDPALAAFCREHEATTRQVLAEVPTAMEDMLIPLSDTLRVCVLCDHQENGVDNVIILSKAKEAGVLLTDRDLPLPHKFLEMVRRMGKAYGLLVPPVPE